MTYGTKSQSRVGKSKDKAKKISRGFTLIESLVVLGILAILATVSSSGFNSFTNKQILDKEAGFIVSRLAEARSLSISSKDGSAYGVKFESDRTTLFKGTSYTIADPNNVTIDLNRSVELSAINLSGGGSEVVFDRLKGTTAQDGSLTLRLLASTTQIKTILIYKTGLVE